MDFQQQQKKKKRRRKKKNTPFNQRKVLVTLEADLLSLQNYILEGKECAMLVWGGDVTAESKFS